MVKRKIFSAALLLGLCLFALTGISFAANHVDQMDVTVRLLDDGSARVTQVWNGTFEEGTENYIPITHLNGMDISNFQASDAQGAYEKLGSWDIDASFEEKARRCGVVEKDDGYELCFGISEYGTKQYTISYQVDRMVGSYEDYDGFNFMFINRNMSTFPTNAKVTITMDNKTALSAQNAAIWAFGYRGQIAFQNGAVVAYTQSALEDDNAMILMLRLNKNLLHPTRSVAESFSTVEKAAKEGSDYADEDDAWLGVVVIIAIGIAFVFLVLYIISRIKRKRAIRKLYQQAEYMRDLPTHGDANITYYLGRQFDMVDDEGAMIGASLLAMIERGDIEPETEHTAGFMGRDKETVSLVLKREPEEPLEARLYQILLSAAGEDGILKEKELKKYSQKNPERLRGFIDQASTMGEAKVSFNGGFVKDPGNSLKDLSESGKKELSELMGFKKYLLDFSLIEERGIEEVAIWDDYLIFATALGIAKEVMTQFKKVYPDHIAQIETYDRNLMIAYHYHYSMYSSMKKAEQAARANGAGGASSLGGGGGFSGGGFGGGSR